MNIKFIGSFLCFVEVTGLEPATAWSQTRNATNCATPRCFILTIFLFLQLLLCLFLDCGCKGTDFIFDYRPIMGFM